MTDRLQDKLFAVPPAGATITASSSEAGSEPALRLFDQAEAASTSVLVSPGNGSNEIAATIERGKGHLARGEFDQADLALTQVVRSVPDNPEAFLVRGQLREQQGDDDRALEDYSTAVQLDVSQLLTFAQRLMAFAARRDFAGAVADADQSLLVNQRLCRACFLRSALYARRQEWAKAVADYTQVLQLDPANSLAHVRRGDANAGLGEWARAVADYTEALRLDPHHATTQNSRGEAYLRLGQIDLAVADFTAAVRLDPQSVAARTNRAAAHLRRGEFDQAIADYSQAIHLSPAAAPAYAGRALARVEKGEWDRALADLTRALALDPALAHAAETPRTAERLRASYEQVVAGIGLFKRMFRQVAEVVGTGRSDLHLPELPSVEHAVVSATPIVEARPPVTQPAAEALSAGDESNPADLMGNGGEARLADEEASEKRRAAKYCRKGLIYQQEGDHDRAAAAYTKALALDPNCVEAYRERGQIRRLERRLEEALEDFNTALKLAPSAELYFRRGVTFAEQKQFKQAFADFDEAIACDPNHALAFLNRGLIEVVVGKFEAAAENADRALEIDPSLTRARFLRGIALGKLGRHDRAVKDIDVVLAHEPDNARAHNHRGLAYAAEGNYNEAIAAYDEAVRHDPKLWAAHFNRGIAFHLKGDHDGAIAAFTQFIGRRPQYAPAYHQRGLAHQARGEFEAAIADFTQAVQLDPSLTEAYTSCLEATRLKYEAASRVALPAPDSWPSLALPPETTASDTAVRETDRTVVEPPRAAETAKKPAPPSGKIQLECPDCGTAGLLDVKHLGKKFRCPGCRLWWRTNAAGNLEQAARPVDTSETDDGPKSGAWKLPAADGGPKSGVWKPLAPVTTKPSRLPADGAASAEADALLAASGTTKPLTDEAGTSRPGGKPTPAAKKPVPVPRRQGGLRYAAMWVATAAQTKAGMSSIALALVLCLVAVPVAFPSLFPSELRSRGHKAARAWLANDAELLRPLTDPGTVENLPLWMATNPPPELAEDPMKAELTVAVERNDGDTAEVILQVKGMKSTGVPGFYVYRHRWVQRKGTWYLQPDLPPAGVGTKKDKRS